MLRSRRRKRYSEEEFNPLSSLANLADVMFVFSVGLLVALMSVWHITPFKNSKVVDVSRGREIKNLPQIQSNAGSGFDEIGTVFRDPKTGKLIMVQPVNGGR